MLSNGIFSTYPLQKQAEIITKLMDLFKSNERAHGVGEVKGSKFDEDKNKWRPGNIRLDKTKATEADWRAHLSGERFLGLGPLLDDCMVWYTSLDVDKLPDSVGYEFDFMEEMGKITRSGIPLVVFRTKSGGLRPTIFFSEPIEAELVIRRMTQIAAQLGYANCEIFPKQSKLDVANGDYSSWIFMPFGPEGGMFPEQCCMNESGNPMELSDAVRYAERMRISREKFLKLFVEEKTARANGKANGKKHQDRTYVEAESYELNLNTIFWDGPICLWEIAHQKCRKDQHYFLLNCAWFFKRKYENWEQPLTWVNFSALEPRGDPQKLNEMIKDLKNKEYTGYTCRTEPICSHCNPYACRQRPFGVGQGQGGIDHFELGITIVNRFPRIFIANVGEGRMVLNAHQLMNLQKYKEVCVENGVSPPNTMKRDDWERNIRKNIEEATIVEPSELLKTNADEWWALGKFISHQVKNMVRTQGEKFLEGKCGDYVRMKLKEEKFYFKWDHFRLYCEKGLQLNGARIESLKMFIDKEAEFIPRDKLRDWFRSSWSMRFSQFDPGIVDQWLHPDDEEEEKEDV